MSSEQIEPYSESVMDPLENSVSTHWTAVTFDPWAKHVVWSKWFSTTGHDSGSWSPNSSSPPGIRPWHQPETGEEPGHQQQALWWGNSTTLRAWWTLSDLVFLKFWNCSSFPWFLPVMEHQEGKSVNRCMAAWPLFSQTAHTHNRKKHEKRMLSNRYGNN